MGERREQGDGEGVGKGKRELYSVRLINVKRVRQD